MPIQPHKTSSLSEMQETIKLLKVLAVLEPYHNELGQISSQLQTITHLRSHRWQAAVQKYKLTPDKSLIWMDEHVLAEHLTAGLRIALENLNYKYEASR